MSAGYNIAELSDLEMAVHQMRETARYIDEHGKAPDDLAEFLRHWAVVVSDAPRPCLKVFV